MIAAEKIVIRYVRRDVPICPHHGPKHAEPMDRYKTNGRTLYFKCPLCGFTAKSIVVIVESH